MDPTTSHDDLRRAAALALLTHHLIGCYFAAWERGARPPDEHLHLAAVAAGRRDPVVHLVRAIDRPTAGLEPVPVDGLPVGLIERLAADPRLPYHRLIPARTVAIARARLAEHRTP